MGRLFQKESPIMTFLERITDFLVLSILWLLCCMPVITIVPASSALYYVSFKIVRKEDVSIIKDYFHSFRDNFKQGIILSFIFLVIGAVLFIDLQLVFLNEGVSATILKIIFVVLTVFFVALAIYVVALQAQFVNTIRQTLKNAALLALHYTLNTVAVLLINALPSAVAFFALKFFLSTILFWLFLAPTIISYLSARCFRMIFDPLIEEITEHQER